jgi:hypothetical protein
MTPAAVACAWLVRLLGATWRVERVGVDERDARFARGERCVFAFWHARLLPLVFTHRRRGIAVLISRHRDGELVARLIERFGFVTARGSSTRGGEGGAREMLRLAERGHLLGISPDGPRGPAEILKPGIVYLASRTGFPVIPVAAAASRSWRLASWDGFRIPWPFARVVVAYGTPIAVPSGLTEDDVQAWCVRVEGALRGLTGETARRAGERE